MRLNSKMLTRTVSEFLDDDCPSMAAALAYYTVFSLPPLLVIVITVMGTVFGRAAVQGRIEQEISGLIGSGAADQIQTMIAKASVSGSGTVATVLGIGALIFAATTAFAQLQASLNRAWDVQPDPDSSGIRQFVLKRVLSFGMILAIGFLLLVSLALSAGLSAFGEAITSYLPDFLSSNLLRAFSLLLSYAIIALLFGALYKVLPDAQVQWRDVLIGAATTAGLFVLGKFLIGLYLGRSTVLSPYGAAGSLALILLWTYYSSMIFLLGAEFTQVWARTHGRVIAPEPGAIRVVREEKRIAGNPQDA